MKTFLLFLLFPFFLFSQYCPYLGPNQLLPCGVNSTTLTADLSQCGVGSNPNQTTNYGVSNIPYVAQTNTGTQLFMTDDSQQGPFQIGFNFCFFGQTYTQFWVGSNGWISFSAGQPVTFTSQPLPTVNALVPKNCIMGPWQDWHPGIGGQIRYQVQGVAPCRKLVVSWIGVPMYSCTNLQGTFHIVIYESTNVIENHIGNKPGCVQWQNGTATQGIHNAAGTLGIAVPGRNSTAWTTVNNSYRYTPSGPVVTPTLTWYQVGNPVPIATGVNQITVTPPVGGANYTCHFVYPTCNAGWSTCNAGGGLGPDTVFVAPGPPNLPPPNIILQDPHCNNGCDGTITVVPNGGTGITTISWNGLGTNFTLNNLCSGNYPFNLVDGAGCTYNGNATLLNPPPLPTPILNNVNPTCFGYCDGSSTVNPLGGIAPYTYQWGNGQITQTATNLCSGFQTVTVFDQFNCPAVGTTTLVDPPMVTINPIVGSDTVCFNSTNNSYSVSSVFPNLTYTWSSGIGVFQGQGTNQITLNVTGVNGGLYNNTLTVFGQNQIGCQSQPQTFTIYDLNILPVITPVGPFCEYDNCITLSATPPNGIFSGMNVWGNQYCPDNGFIGLDNVNYTYSQSGCWFDTSINVQVYPRPNILPVTNGVVDENLEYHQICEGDTITDIFDLTSVSGGYNEWYIFGDTITNNTLSVTWDMDGIFTFQGVRWDNGCVSNPQSFTITLELCPNEIFYIPNAFTPDGDEKNNVFKPIITSGVDIFNYTFLIYNRWGQIVWESFNPNIGWDGTYNGTMCQDGVYTWKLRFKTPKTDEVKEFEGSLTLIR